MTSSTEILRGSAARAVPAARLDSDLFNSPFATTVGSDPRLVAPALARAFEAEVDRAREQARVEGHRLGLEQGRAAAAAEAELAAATEQERTRVARAAEARQVAAALTGLAAAADEIRNQQAAAAAGLERAVTHAGFALAEALLGREPVTARDAVTRALRIAPAGTPVRLRLNPHDAEVIRVELADNSLIRVLADPTVEPGGCIADAGALCIDAHLGAAVQRVREVLSS